MKKIVILFVILFGFVLADDALEAGFEQELEKEYQGYEVNDPLSGYNKAMTAFNIALYDYGFRPILKGYNAVTPSIVRTGVRNFFTNLAAPLRFVGNVLQFKFDAAGDEFKRFLANTIMGFGGLMDPASKMGLNKHQADIGAVLNHWGVGSGFHIVLPVLGPSNLRDLAALPADWFLLPTSYIDDTWTRIGVSAYGFGNELSFHLDELDELYHGNANTYLFLRDAYEQRRNEMSK